MFFLLSIYLSFVEINVSLVWEWNLSIFLLNFSIQWTLFTLCAQLSIAYDLLYLIASQEKSVRKQEQNTKIHGSCALLCGNSIGIEKELLYFDVWIAMGQSESRNRHKIRNESKRCTNIITGEHKKVYMAKLLTAKRKHKNENLEVSGDQSYALSPTTMARCERNKKTKRKKITTKTKFSW